MNEPIQRKVWAGLPVMGLAGFLAWLVDAIWGFKVPAEQALFIAGLVNFGVQYYVSNHPKVAAIVEQVK